MGSPSQPTTRQHLNANAYAIFLILERQRNIKLRELYRNIRGVDTLLPVISEESSSSASSAITTKKSLRQAARKEKKTSSSSMSRLPKFPPRYQALSTIITSDVLMMQLRTPSSGSSPQTYMDEYKNLDLNTNQFINDIVRILQDRYNEELENNETKLEINMRPKTRRQRVGGASKMFTFRVEKKLSLIV